MEDPERTSPSSTSAAATDLEVDLAAPDPTTRRAAVDAFGALVREDLDAATAQVPAVARRLREDSLIVARGAAEALEPLARNRPGKLVDDLDAVVEVLAADSIDLSLSGARLLSPVARDRPGAVTAHSGRLLEILVDDEVPDAPADVPETVDRGARQMLRTVQQETRERRQFVRRTAANAVVAAVETDPTHLSEVTSLARLLDDQDPGVVGPAVDALGLLAEADPETVRPITASLRACLDHDLPAIRARTIRALGYLGADSVVPDLEAMAVGDDHEDVRELAAETATFLVEE